MKPFSTRLKAYLKENNISQYRFARTLSHDSKNPFRNTLRKVQRWVAGYEPRLTTFEGAKTLIIIQNWENPDGNNKTKSSKKKEFISKNERNEMLDLKGQGIKSYTYFERSEIVETFCNSGHSFSEVLEPRQEKIIRLYFGLNKSGKSLKKAQIARKLHISSTMVRVNLLISLRCLKYPHFPFGKSFQNKTFYDGRIILDKFFKQGHKLSMFLNKRQAEFIRLRFGLKGRKPLSFQDIGDRYHVTREYIRKSIAHSLPHLQ